MGQNTVDHDTTEALFLGQNTVDHDRTEALFMGQNTVDHDTTEALFLGQNTVIMIQLRPCSWDRTLWIMIQTRFIVCKPRIITINRL